MTGAAPDAAGTGFQERADAGFRALQRWYCPWTGRWRSTGWWNAANALTTLIRYAQLTGDGRYRKVIGRTYLLAGLRHRHFINKFYDDNAWWGLAWLDAHALTGEARYAEAARVIFEQMTGGWDEVCGGGVWWNTDRRYKNAITNELFLSMAARLHLVSPGAGSRYRDWALREWDWFDASGMTGPSGLVNDGLTAGCRNNGKPCYTYNQGVVLGGLAALHEITGDAAYLRAGESIADAAIAGLVSPVTSAAPGILVEPGEDDIAAGKKHTDGSQFKGIFIRNLHAFTRHVPRPAYGEFIIRNAGSVWNRSRNDSDQFGMRWTGPFDVADASRQSSALDALLAAAALTSAGRALS